MSIPSKSLFQHPAKPYQLNLIRAHGMCVPDTLITTDADAVLAFQEEHREIVYKSVSGVRSRVSKFRPQHIDRLANLSSCPTQFQQYISGVDYRIHVIGEEVFAARIVSAADDYRYADSTGHDIEVTPCGIPAEIAESFQRTASGLGLPVAGLDLRRTEDDRWFCFEVNPSPGFTFYDRLPGEPIAHAVARLLAGDTAL